MKFDVFFEASPADYPSHKYVASQPEWQQSVLKSFIAELLEKNNISHPDARRISNDRWSLWVRKDGEEAVNHVCYLARADESGLSDFAKMLLSADTAPATSEIGSRALQLVILNANNNSTSAGRTDEFFDPSYFASSMDSIKRDLFLKAIADIRNNIKTNDYSLNADGSILIHINRPDIAYGIHISCVAKWTNG